MTHVSAPAVHDGAGHTRSVKAADVFVGFGITATKGAALCVESAALVVHRDGDPALPPFQRG
jgi:hypothetical protein